MSETRILGKKGTLTVPAKLRRQLGLYGSTPVNIKLSKEDNTLLVLKARKHCVACGKRGKDLYKTGDVYICKDCMDVAEIVHDKDETSLSEVIDNYNINTEKIAELKRQNLEYERIIQDEGLKHMTGSTKTVTLSSDENNEVQVQISYTVKDPTIAAWKSIHPFMNDKVADSYISVGSVTKFEMSAAFKKAIILMYTGDYSFADPTDILTKAGVPEEECTSIMSKWKLTKGIKLGLDYDTTEKLNKCSNMQIIRSVFPEIRKQSDIDFILDCFIVTDSVKLKSI